MGGFEEFFADHYDEVVRTLALTVGDRARAEDAAQEAFAKAYRRWPRVEAMDRPVGWVVVVGVRQLRRWITRHDRRFGIPTETSTGDGGVGDHAESVAAGAAVQLALDALPPRQRATVVLRYLCDLPTVEVARALGCSPGTVKSALHSALRSMRVELDVEEVSDHADR